MKREISSVKTVKRSIRFICFCLALLLLVSGLAGCGSKKELAFEDYLSEGFAFPGAEWGMNPAELKKALGITLVDSGAVNEDEDGNIHITYEGDKFDFCGLTSSSTFQFRNDHLWAAGFSHAVKEGTDGNAVFEDLHQKALAAYGEEQEAIVDKELEFSGRSGYSTTMYRWEKNNADGKSTAFMLSCTMAEGTVTHISVDTSIFPIPDEF